MKLKVKSGNGVTESFDVEEDLTFVDFTAIVGATFGLNTDDVSLSFNRTDPLDPGRSGESLKEIGIVAGDQLFLIGSTPSAQTSSLTEIKTKRNPSEPMDTQPSSNISSQSSASLNSNLSVFQDICRKWKTRGISQTAVAFIHSLMLQNGYTLRKKYCKDWFVSDRDDECSRLCYKHPKSEKTIDLRVVASDTNDSRRPARLDVRGEIFERETITYTESVLILADTLTKRLGIQDINYQTEIVDKFSKPSSVWDDLIDGVIRQIEVVVFGENSLATILRIEDQHILLSKLPVRDLLNLETASRAIRQYTCNNTLWRKLIHRDFRGSANNLIQEATRKDIPLRIMYQRHYLRQKNKKEKDAALELSSPLSLFVRPPRRNPYFPIMPPIPPPPPPAPWNPYQPSPIFPEFPDPIHPNPLFPRQPAPIHPDIPDFGHPDPFGGAGPSMPNPLDPTRDILRPRGPRRDPSSKDPFGFGGSSHRFL